MFKLFIDGREGTTGLRITERLAGRSDISLLTLPEELRKDSAARAEMLNAADVAILCLPDAAAIEAVGMVKNPSTRIIDASTAHRTAKGWTYGFPELSPSFVRLCRRLCALPFRAVTQAALSRSCGRSSTRGFFRATRCLPAIP